VRARMFVVALYLGSLAAFAIDPNAARAAALPTTDLRLAYIDPGSGSFVLQALIAAIAGAAVAIKAYWTRIRQLLGIDPAKSEDEGTDSESTDA